MFRAYDRYRHMSCLDLDIEVVKVKYRDPKRIKLKIKWIWRNTGLDHGFPPENVEIQRADFWKWRLIPLSEQINQRFDIK
jgi:hypothetical protein